MSLTTSTLEWTFTATHSVKEVPKPIVEEYESATSIACRNIYVVPGRDEDQTSILVLGSVASRFCHPNVVHSRDRDGNIYLPYWSPEVVKEVLFCLISEEVREESQLGSCKFWTRNEDVDHLAEFFRLASALELDWACENILRVLKKKHLLNYERPWEVLGMDIFETLIDHEIFTKWMARGLLRKAAKIEQTSLENNHGTSWVIEVLMEQVKYQGKQIARLKKNLNAAREKADCIRSILGTEEPGEVPDGPLSPSAPPTPSGPLADLFLSDL